jgi:hypothetical protein
MSMMGALASAGAGGAAVGFGFFIFLYAFIVLLAFGGIALGIWALVDASSKPDWAWARAGENKTTYILLIALGFVMCQLLSLVASIIYLTNVRKKLQAAMAGGPPQWGPYQPHGYAPGYGQPGSVGYAPSYPTYPPTYPPAYEYTPQADPSQPDPSAPGAVPAVPPTGPPSSPPTDGGGQV